MDQSWDHLQQTVGALRWGEQLLRHPGSPGPPVIRPCLHVGSVYRAQTSSGLPDLHIHPPTPQQVPPRQSTVSLLFLEASVTSAGLLVQIVSSGPAGRPSVLPTPLQTFQGPLGVSCGLPACELSSGVCVCMLALQEFL